ncbi:hypothetical protein AGLY_014473 [Aphis glycines]|uniref:Uncharacterized protein n=1 Tax=Aphis glycines TaxID=307491 RepID=A0A6G0T3B0_APHGL|nr:hypothetical protein AGLY_014473 [Aphis glycines]
MTTMTSITALFGCILLHLIVLTSTAPVRSTDDNSDLPFEFNFKNGSVVTEDNVLTQSVSSDGQNVLKTNDPQPIKKYQKVNKSSKSSTNQNPTKKQHANNYKAAANSAVEYPAGHTSTSYYSTFSPMMNNQWDFFENFSKYIPGLSDIPDSYYIYLLSMMADSILNKPVKTGIRNTGIRYIRCSRTPLHRDSKL